MAFDDGRGLQGRTVLAVFAHPDDESIACGGTLARLSDAGARVVLVCASRGERGHAGARTLGPDAELAQRRTSELGEAAKILGIADLLVFSHPDGNLRWADVPELHAEIVSAIDEYRPDAVITFAEDGLYWHLDHIGIHERTCTAVRSFGDTAPALYYVTMRKGAMREVCDTAAAKGWSPPLSGVWAIVPDAFGVAARRPSFTVDVHDWVPRKLAALRCHRSQLGEDNPFAWLDEVDARRCLGVEQFRRARPHSGTSLLEPIGQRVMKTI
ncbi:MAG: PIG-L deacetylase family protein [Vicinamibacterales bacterium]